MRHRFIRKVSLKYIHGDGSVDFVSAYHHSFVSRSHFLFSSKGIQKVKKPKSLLNLKGGGLDGAPKLVQKFPRGI